MKGARTIVIKTRAVTLLDMVCDSPAAQRSEQIVVNIIHAVHNHWPPPPPWPDIERANNNARSDGAKNSNNKIVPRHASDTLNPSVSATCRSHSFSLHAAGVLERASTAWRGTRSEEHTSELQSHHDLVCRLLLEKKKNTLKP